MKKGITSGPLISDSHQSVIKTAVPYLAKLKKYNGINRIVVGKIKNTRSKVAKLLAENTGTSVKLTVKGHGEIQEFYVIGNNLNHIENIVKHIA